MERRLSHGPGTVQGGGRESRTLLGRVIGVVARDAAAWGLTSGQAVRLAVVPLVATVMLTAAAPFPRLFIWLIDEDMLVESLQVVLLAIALVLCGRLSTRLVASERPILGILYGLLTLATFFVIGEEISWGQRLLGLRTPIALEAINAQGEITIHNIHGFHRPTTYAVMLAGMYGAIMPLVRFALPAGRRHSVLSDLLIPPLCLVTSFAVPAGYRLCRFVLKPELYVIPGYRVFVITEFSELGELCLYFGLAVFAWLNLRRLQPRQ